MNSDEESGKKETPALQKKGRKICWIGLILLRNTLLEERLKGREEEQEGGSSYRTKSKDKVHKPVQIRPRWRGVAVKVV